MIDQERVAERVTAKVAGRGKGYKEYFEKKLKKWNVKSPAEIPDDKKDDFFEEVDKGWNSADESGKDGKTASVLTSAVKVREFDDKRGHRWTIDDGEYIGHIKEIDGPGIPLYRIFITTPDAGQYKFKRQVKKFKQAMSVVKDIIRALSDGAGGVDLTREWMVASKKAGELMSMRDRMAGCEKLPAGPMRENCEKKKEEGKKNDKKEEGKKNDKKDDKKPDFLKKK